MFRLLHCGSLLVCLMLGSPGIVCNAILLVLLLHFIPMFTSPMFFLYLQCSCLGSPSLHAWYLMHALCPSSPCLAWVASLYYRAVLKLFPDFITVSTPSGWHAFSIHFLTPLKYKAGVRVWECTSGFLWWSFCMLVHIPLDVLIAAILCIHVDN